MLTLRRAMGLAFVAALALGLGCDSSTETPPPRFILDGKIYTEKFTCNETSAPGAPLTCPDLNQTDVIQFEYTGGTTFEVRNVPDTGFIYTGELVGMTFTWTATSPNGYTESGSWDFVSSGAEFTGSSHYVADAPGTYSGDCNTNGTLGTATVPADPPPPAGCP